MDMYRAQTKRIKAASIEATRAARMMTGSRGQHNNNRYRPQTAAPSLEGQQQQGSAPPLRRYSDLNLGVQQQQQQSSTPAASGTPATTTTAVTQAAARPHTTGGCYTSSASTTVMGGTKCRGGCGGGGPKKVIPDKTRCAAPGCDGRTRMATLTATGHGGSTRRVKTSGDDWPLSKPRPVPAFLV